jgi:hypothetical protein
VITQFTILTSHTVNLGNFESTRIEASLTVAVSEGEDLESLKGAAQVELRKLLEETFRAQQRKK